MKQQGEAYEESVQAFFKGMKQDIETSVQTEQHRLRQYLRFFGISDRKALHLSEEEIISHLPEDIAYQTDQFAKLIQIKITHHSRNYQLIDLEVCFGYFIFKKISIIHMNQESPVHDVHSCDSGGYCTVYYCECGGDMLAFKCFYKKHFTFSDANTSLLETVIKEYCLLRIASCFKIGPKIARSLGFDIMIYPECIQICMECCKPLPPKCKPQIKDQLKRQLLMLHKLQIIHHDIKEDNICFSPAFNSLVFIDFGMSRFVKEKIGFKSETKYRGTLHYCGDEMASLLEKNRKDFHHIDLYFNDMVGLQKTFENLRYQQSQQDVVLICQPRSHKGVFTVCLDSFYRLHTIKKSIFQNKYSFETIEKLDASSICSLIKFVTTLMHSPKLTILEIYLRKLIKDISMTFEEQKQSSSLKEYTNLQGEEVQENSLYPEYISQTMQNLKIIIQRYIDFLVLAGFYPFPMIFGLLKTPTFINLEAYIFVLAKALQINASYLSLAQLNEVCLIAQERIEQFCAMRLNTKYSQEEAPCFFLASEFLLKKAMKYELKGMYFNVYCYIVNNILAFNILSNQQLLEYYDSLLRLPLSFENKLLAILKFHSGLVWMYINASSLDQYKLIKRQLKLRSKSYVNFYKGLTNSQAYFLRIIWENQVLQEDLLEKENNLSKNTKCQLKMWILTKQFLRINFNVKILDQMCSLESELILQKAFIMNYYHVFYLIYGLISQNWWLLDSLIKTYKGVFRGRLNNQLVLALQNVKKLRIHDFKKLEDIIPVLRSIASCSHPLTNFIIFDQLDKFAQRNENQFHQLDKELKAQIMRLILFSHNKYLAIYENYTFEDQLICLKKKVLKKADIFIRYRLETGDELNDVNLQEDKQQYFKIRNKIQQSSIIEVNKNQQNMLSCLLALAAFLIKEREIQKAIELCKFLYRMTYFVSTQQIHKRSVLEFIFRQIFEKGKDSFYMNYRETNRQLYFDYAKILKEENKQDTYIQDIHLFIDTVRLMYKYQFSGLSKFINRISKIVQMISNRGGTFKYFMANQEAFFSIRQQRIDHQNIFVLQKQLSLLDSPYNVFALSFISAFKQQKDITKGHFLRIFAYLNFVNKTARQYVLRRQYLGFLIIYGCLLKPRKRIKLIINVINNGATSLSQRQLMKLFIPPKSLKLLKAHENADKKKCIMKKFKRFNSIIMTKNQQRLRASVSYRQMILFK